MDLNLASEKLAAIVETYRLHLDRDRLFKETAALIAEMADSRQSEMKQAA